MHLARTTLAIVPSDASTEWALTLSGNPGIQSERMRDIEAGYRAQWSRTLSFDLAAYYSRYHALLMLDDQPSVTEFRGNVVRVIQPLRYGNSGKAASYGGETSLSWTPFARWRLVSGYANLHVNSRASPDANPTFGMLSGNYAPRHVVQFRSFLNLTRRLEWDQWFSTQSRFADARTAGHTRIDTRLAWRLGERVEISVVGQNLYRPGYIEFAENSWIISSSSRRSIFGKVAWTF